MHFSLTCDTLGLKKEQVSVARQRNGFIFGSRSFILENVCVEKTQYNKNMSSLSLMESRHFHPFNLGHWFLLPKTSLYVINTRAGFIFGQSNRADVAQKLF